MDSCAKYLRSIPSIPAAPLVDFASEVGNSVFILPDQYAILAGTQIGSTLVVSEECLCEIILMMI